MGKTVKAKSRKSIHEALVKWFDDKPRGTVLDAPAGYGNLSKQLHEMGFEVTCGEIEPEIFAVDALKCIYTDLNNKIDAPDNSFDYICCIDGIEHMTDPYTAVKELSRVLKSGGTGIFSIPNYSNIEKRVNFLLKGYLTKPKTKEDYERNGENLFNFHNSPLTITLIDLMFSINNLSLEEIVIDKKKSKQFLFYPLILLLRLIQKLSSEKSRKKHQYSLTSRKDVILGSNTLICIVKKK